jgi:hypothetical protein
MAGFGFGNFIKPQATPVRPGDLPGFKDLSMQEKLMMLGSAMRGDMAGAQQIPMLAVARARQAQLSEAQQEYDRFLSGEGVPTLTRRDRPAIAEPQEPEADPMSSAASGVIAGLGGLDGVPIKRDRVNVDIPQFGVIPGEKRQGPPSLREALPYLAKLRRAGADIKTDIDLLDKVGPDYDYVNGVRVDKRDPNGTAFVPTFDKGEEPLYDANGRIVAVRNMDGSIKSKAEAAAAITEAQERAKAGYDLVEVPMSDGSTVKLPRLEAIQRLGGGGGVPMVGAAPAVGGGSAPAGFGRSQTPAEKVAAEGRAKTAVEVEALTPKARSTLDTLDRKTDFVLSALRKAKEQATGGVGGAAGLNALAAAIPETAAYDLRSTLDTIEAAVGFDELQQMRDNSPTGGAVGNLTDRELSLLSSLRGSLEQGQSPDQLRANIERMISEIEKVRNERKAAFTRQYSQRSGAKAPGSSGITPEQARAELARRRAARGGQ